MNDNDEITYTVYIYNNVIIEYVTVCYHGCENVVRCYLYGEDKQIDSHKPQASHFPTSVPSNDTMGKQRAALQLLAVNQ